MIRKYIHNILTALLKKLNYVAEKYINTNYYMITIEKIHYRAQTSQHSFEVKRSVMNLCIEGSPIEYRVKLNSKKIPHTTQYGVTEFYDFIILNWKQISKEEYTLYKNSIIEEKF